MKTKLLTGLLVLALLVGAVACLAFLAQDSSAQVAQGHPPATSPGCDNWPHGPIVCDPDSFAPPDTVYNASAPGCTKPPFIRICPATIPQG